MGGTDRGARFGSQGGPQFALRGPVIGLQKPELEPPRQNYEFLTTPGLKPQFLEEDGPGADGFWDPALTDRVCRYEKGRSRLNDGGAGGRIAQSGLAV